MTHVIRRQYLDIELRGTESDGLALQRSLPALCRDWLTPALGRALERCAPPEGHLCIEQLELDLGSLALDRLEHELPESAARAVEKWFREHAPPAAGSSPPAPASGYLQRKSAQHSIHEAFLHFLNTGSLPWSFHLPAGSTLEQVLLDCWQHSKQSDLEPAAAGPALLQALAAAPIRERLIRQFSPRFLKTVLSRLSPEGEKLADRVTAAGVSQQERPWENELAPIAKALPSPAAELPDNPCAPHSEFCQGEHPEAEEGIYIGNAGLVLLHPFLPRFFQALGIAEEDKLLQPEPALCLLHYLASGEIRAPEYELMLPKILCNLPLGTPVRTGPELGDPEKEEAGALLEAAIRHWDALRNTSPDALRGTFLLRPGKLSQRGDGDWLLQVESGSCDILLEQLSWSIAMIRLPWMERMLWVEWS